MPQDIPVEKTETLLYTPECLAEMDNPPVFHLRVGTTREKRERIRVLNEQGVVQHSQDEMRATMLAGLKELYDEEIYNRDVPLIEAHWAALDDFLMQKALDPDAEFEHDPAVTSRIAELEIEIAQSYRPLGKMRANNSHAGEISVLSLVAVMVIKASGLGVTTSRERGYLTIDSVAELQEALQDKQDTLPGAGVKRGMAFAQLIAACTLRLFLDKDEEKNSESRSPSETGRKSSKTSDLSSPKVAGKSPASKTRSPKTPVSA